MSKLVSCWLPEPVWAIVERSAQGESISTTLRTIISRWAEQDATAPSTAAERLLFTIKQKETERQTLQMLVAKLPDFPEFEAPILALCEASGIPFGMLLKAPRPVPREECRIWLERKFQEHSSIPVREIQSEAQQRGFTSYALTAAKQVLDLASERRSGGWYWKRR